MALTDHSINLSFWFEEGQVDPVSELCLYSICKMNWHLARLQKRKMMINIILFYFLKEETRKGLVSVEGHDNELQFNEKKRINV